MYIIFHIHIRTHSQGRISSLFPTHDNQKSGHRLHSRFIAREFIQVRSKFQTPVIRKKKIKNLC